MVRRKARHGIVPGNPRVYEATLGAQGKVIKGAVITEGQAIARRRADRDIVVCEGTHKANRALAQKIENQVGPNQPGTPHTKSAGRYALPHFQQTKPPPEGHSFYETDQRKAARRS
jgi:hypothetical protein